VGGVDGIDVLGCFGSPYVYGNMQMGFWLIFEKPPFTGTYPRKTYLWKHIHDICVVGNILTAAN